MHSRFSTDIMFAYMIAEPTNIRQRLEAFGTTVSMVFSLTWMLARNGNRSVSRPRGDDQYVVWVFIAIFFSPYIKTAGLAQSVERQALNLMVEGSSPSFGGFFSRDSFFSAIGKRFICVKVLSIPVENNVASRIIV